MKTIEVSKATLPLSDYTKEVKKKPVIITKEGRPVAVLVSIPDADIETVSLSNNPKFIALIERSRARQKSEGAISSEEMRRRLERPKKSAHIWWHPALRCSNIWTKNWGRYLPPALLIVNILIDTSVWSLAFRKQLPWPISPTCNLTPPFPSGFFIVKWLHEPIQTRLWFPT